MRKERADGPQEEEVNNHVDAKKNQMEKRAKR